jgi:hypothetical protein
MATSSRSPLVKWAVGGLVAVAFGYLLVWQWMLSRVYVGPGEMLVLKANVGKDNPDPANLQVVPTGFKGIQEGVIGEGRHFYNPFLYERRRVSSSVTIKPTEVGVVVSRSGKPLASGQFLADKGFKGIQRRALTPGRWRLNPIAYEVRKMAAVQIRPGYVGCITALAPDPELGVKKQGILKQVLQPGIYYINPKAYKVEEVEIGYHQLTLNDVQFKSIDGFRIKLDVSVVWGVKPKNVPFLIHTLGNISQIVSKIIQPQVNTIVRLEGSKHGAQEFIKGRTRLKFQMEFTKRLKAIAREKKIEIQIGLVRNIEIPKEVREPISQTKIAVEERKTKKAMGKTQKLRNKLEELRQDVKKGVRETHAETKRMIAKIRADGESKILSIKGEKEVEVAKIMRQVAEIEAKIKLLKGKTEAQVVALTKKARADKFVQFAKALGSSKALVKYTFTKNLRKDLTISIRYAGPGTFWTDMGKSNKILRNAANAKILQSR